MMNPPGHSAILFGHSLQEIAFFVIEYTPTPHFKQESLETYSPISQDKEKSLIEINAKFCEIVVLILETLLKMNLAAPPMEALLN
jgi:hypothetical protein